MANKTQKKYSPLYRKQIAENWQSQMSQMLPEYVDPELAAAFEHASAASVAEFCLEMYRQMGLMEGIRVARSSDPEFRRAACDIADFFVDVPYEGETVRARCDGDTLKLHKGGDAYIDCRPRRSRKSKSARRATRGCVGCNRSSAAPTTWPGRAKLCT